MDALVLVRKGDSMLTRNPKRYAALFLISVPAWWLFEVLNWRTQNWFYVGREFFTDIQYAALASLSFSTVMPAVFGTAELASTFGWISRLRRGFIIAPTRLVLLSFFSAGCLMLAMLLVWPQLFFPFIWISGYFILAPINVWLGHHSLTEYTGEGDWRPVIALWIGCLICAFFWELWNFNSYPKWIYHIPYLNTLHIFEMPLFGYGGYLPFALELFAIYNMIVGLLVRGREFAFVRLGTD